MEPEQFGPYRLEGSFRPGGPHELFRAYDTVRDRLVTIARVSAELSGDPDFRERFQRDVQLVAALTEPHIVPVHDFGEIDDRLFVDMRLVVGVSLARTLEDGPVEPASAAAITIQVCDALEAAHAVGLVHGDLRAQSVVLGGTNNSFAQLLDFGLAQPRLGPVIAENTDTADASWPQCGYAAPERFTGGACEPRVDCYAVVCLLHQMLIGALPFPGDNLRMMLGHTLQEPPRPTRANPELAPGWDDVIALGLSKEPDARFQSASELALAVRSVLAPDVHVEQAANLRVTNRTPVTERSTTSRPSEAPVPATVVPPAPIPAPVGDEPPLPRSTRIWRRRGWALATLAGLVVVGLGTVAAVLLTKDGPDPPPNRVTVGARPEGLAVSPDGRRVYVANAASDSVSVLDGRTLEVAATVRTGRNPRDVAVTSDGARVYVANFGSNDVSVIDTATNVVTASIPVGRGPKSIALSPDGRHGYVANLYSDSLSVIDLGTGALSTGLTCGDGPSSVAVSPDGSLLYVSDTATGSLTVIDARSRSIVVTAPVGTEPERISLSPDGRRSYISNYLTNTVRVVDNASYRLLAAIPVGNAPLGLAPTPDGRRVYVANVGVGALSVIDTASNTVVGQVAVPTQTGAADVAISPDGRRAYVTSRESGTVSVLDIGR